MEAVHLETITPELLSEMGDKYDPEKLVAWYAKRPTALTARSLRVATALGGVITGILTDIAAGQFESNAVRRASQLRRVLSGLGPSFIKVGQALSARPDLLPKPYLDALAQLQDRLPSFPTPVAHALIEEELGRPVDEVYSYLSPEPVAAASLGQVYRGILRSTGEPVAVKVQRPGISEGIAIDMVLLRRLMAAVDNHIPVVSQPLVPLVDEFAARLFAELDYVQEGHNAERFRDLYKAVPRVKVPGIKWDATSRRVITMEWIEGVKLTDKVAMESSGLDVIDFVTVGVECTLRQLLEAGFFHADPHPGNLLATKSGDLVYLDFGMMSEAPASARYALIAHVVHLVNRDYLAMCRDYYALEFMDPSIDTAPIAPALADFFEDVLKDSTVSRLNFRTIVDGLGGVLFQYPFRVPAYYALILRSLTVLEGLALSADPKYKLLAAAYPYMARRLLTDPAPQLRASLEDLVLKDGKLRWARLENLWREGSKSMDFESGQVWQLAEWVCSEGGRPVRGPLAAEVVRLVDAQAAAATRSLLQERLGGDEKLAKQLVPAMLDEGKMLRRGRALWSFLTSSAGESFGSGTGSGLQIKFGSGPWGVPAPSEVAGGVRQVREALAASGPRVRSLLERPGAQELILNVQWQLTQRVAARSIKLFAALFSGGTDGGQGNARPSDSPRARGPPRDVVSV